MPPTVIFKGERKVAVIPEEESPGVIRLTPNAYVKVKKHPKKPGHYVSHVGRHGNTVPGTRNHIGKFTENSPRPIGRDFKAKWVPESQT